MKIKHVFTWMLMLVMAFGCSTDLGDVEGRLDEVEKQLSDHEKRIKKLEEWEKQVKEQIQTIRQLVDGNTGKIGIVKVEELSDGSGYKITMSDNRLLP